MQVFKLLKKTYLSWDKNDPWAKSAIVAYYALFSLPSLLMITVHIAGIFLGPDAVQGKITNEIGGLIGKDSAAAIEGMIANAALAESSTITVIIGVGMLLFGATGVFFQLQRALNNIWSVRSKKINFIDTLKRRATSFGVIIAIGLLLLISLLLSALISGFSELIANYYSVVSSGVIELLNFIVTEIFILSIFATIFKVLPDIHIKWKTTLLGAFVTSMLFLVGKYVLGFYFQQADPGSVYGAAGSVVLILLWVYYTCLILFFGAEFTVNWALQRGIKVEPTSNATFSYEKELEELRAYKKKIEVDKKKAQELARNPPS
ncbi:YihY/virulence factor BrkB family protein [Rasiella sp. SM2506]|uniref:YihY/virulence factor BrkB family protein n=1 Tax=Rasiella sp. SM2506 TaxID=3423914 RepID=UPI003D795299